MADDHKDKHGDAPGDEGHKPHRRGGGHGHGHGGGHEEHGGVAEWLISFADNVALLMGFFVILTAMNMAKPKPAQGLGNDEKSAGAGNDDQFMELVYGIRHAFHSLPSLESKDPKDLPLIEYMQRRTLGQTSVHGEPGLKREVQAIRPSDYNAPTGMFPFDNGSATLQASSFELVKDIAAKQRGQRFIIELRGHVSAVEAAGGIDAALDLSLRRARAVGSALVANGLRWQNLRVVGCADHDRLAAIATDTAEHRTNQRVEIIVTNEVLSPDPYAQEPR